MQAKDQAGARPGGPLWSHLQGDLPRGPREGWAGPGGTRETCQQLGGGLGVTEQAEHCRAGDKEQGPAWGGGVGQADGRGQAVTPEQAGRRTALWPGHKAQAGRSEGRVS